MAKIEKNTLAYLGIEYQERLIAQLLTDDKFANSILDIVDPNYFEDQFLRIIVATIKDAKKEYDIIPDIGSLRFRLLEGVKEDIQRKYVLAQLQKIQEANLNDSLKIQDVAMRFCKQQELTRTIKDIQKIIDKGNLEDYEQCEAMLRKALEYGDNKDIGIDVFDNIEAVLEDDFRKPIRTGIKGLDEIMDGGLAKTELGVILAPFGVGKSSLITKIANTAMMDGYNVLQIFFEDNPKVIQRKHLSCWTGIDLNSLTIHREEILSMVKEMTSSTKNGKGRIQLVKMSSDGTTMPKIRAYIKKKIAEGFKPDMVLLDYIDCVEASKHFDDINAAEGSNMRQFETLLDDFNLVGWTAVQGNRSSIKAEVVEADQMGGSIKKAQIGHFIISIAKTLDQKEDGTATMAILKSRFGKSGIIFQNVIFDNATIRIEILDEAPKTQRQYIADGVKSDQARVNSVLDALKAKKSLENLVNNNTQT